MRKHVRKSKTNAPNKEDSQDPYPSLIDFTVDETGRTNLHCEGVNIPYMMQVLAKLVETLRTPPKIAENENDNQARLPTDYLYDVFISHASEDKETLVDGLVEELENLGVKVWYDRLQISWGDSMRTQIDAGLRHAQYAIIVLSPNYIRKDKYWTHGELDSLFQLESMYGKKLLPLWHELTQQEVAEYSPLIASRRALSTDDYSIKEIALAVEQILRADT